MEKKHFKKGFSREKEFDSRYTDCKWLNRADAGNENYEYYPLSWTWFNGVLGLLNGCRLGLWSVEFEFLMKKFDTSNE